MEKSNSERVYGRSEVYRNRWMGILNSLTNLVTGSLNINIKSLNIGSEAGFFNGELNALVHDTKHLDDILDDIQLAINKLKTEAVDSGFSSTGFGLIGESAGAYFIIIRTQKLFWPSIKDSSFFLFSSQYR